MSFPPSLRDSALLLAAGGFLITQALMAVYGVHRYVLVALYYRRGRDAGPEPPPPLEWPRVTVQLPLYNERYVVERLIDAACALDYPADRLEIQVLDDSTDDTAELARARVAWHRARGVDVVLRHREHRAGFKAGALAGGLAAARGELIAVFDADFVPTADFLRRGVPHFADPAVGMVQTRWGHLNHDYSTLTGAQALFLDSHFTIEHVARASSGRFFNFNGTAGLWRRTCIEAAGGWQHDTLTEDLDLSYRAQLAGWRFVYRRDLIAPAELPVEVNAFKSQQRRWAKGSIQTARKILPILWRSPLPLAVKIEGFYHLTSNVAYLMLLLSALLLWPALSIDVTPPAWLAATTLTVLFLCGTGAVSVFFICSQMEQGRSFWRAVAHVPLALVLGVGLSLINARAVVEGFLPGSGAWERTPKYGVRARRQRWVDDRYRMGAWYSGGGEALLALYAAATTVHAVHLERWTSLPFLALLVTGFGYVAWLSFSGRGRVVRPVERTLSRREAAEALPAVGS